MSEKKRVLPFNFTVDEMDRGDGMKFHPCTGDRLIQGRVSRGSELDRMGSFENGSYTIYGGYGMYRSLPRISDEKDHKAGEPYLGHWSYDPFTGEEL